MAQEDRDRKQRQQMDRYLESQGLLNYQTQGLTQAQVASRFGAAKINTDPRWMQQQYGSRPMGQTQQFVNGTQRRQAVPYNASPDGFTTLPDHSNQPPIAYEFADNGLVVKVKLPKPTRTAGTGSNEQAVINGHANWTDIFVDERKTILADPNFYKQNRLASYPQSAQQQIVADPNFKWDQLADWQKVFYEASSGPAAKYIMAAPMAIPGMIAGTAVAGPLGGLVGGAATYALGVRGSESFNPAGNLKQQPTTEAKAMYLLNELAQWIEQQAGYQSTKATMLYGQSPATEAKNREWLADPTNKMALWEASRTTWDYTLGEGAQNLLPGIESTWEMIKNPSKAAQAIEQVKQRNNGVLPADWVVAVGQVLDPKLRQAKPGEGFIVGANDPVKVGETFKSPFSLAGESLDSTRMIVNDARYIAEQVEAGRDVTEVVNEVMMKGSQTVGGQIGDLVGQSFFDPLNLMGEAQSVVGMGAAKLAGDKVALAAFTEVDGAYKAAQRYKTLIQTGEAAKIDPNFDAKNLGLIGRTVAGLNSRGEVKTGGLLAGDRGLLDADPRPVNRVVDFAREALTETPQSRAETAASMFSRNVGQILSLFTTPEEAVGYITRIAGADDKVWSELGSRIGNSPEWYTVLPALRNYATTKLQGIATAWEKGAVNREALSRIADVLGDKPSNLLDDWSQRRTHEQDYTRIIDRAKKAGTPEAQALLTDAANGVFTAATLQQIIDIFHGEGSLPYDPAQWRYMMYADLVDHFQNWTADHLQLDQTPEAKSAFFRTIGILKAAQSIMLLGFSPGYAIQNGLGGMFHLAVTGIYGGMTGRQMSDWLKTWETPIPRMDEGVGIGGIVDTTKSNPISDAVKGTGPLTWMKQKMGQVSRAMPMSRLSSSFESRNSTRGYVTAIRQYWNNSWQRGVGFREMPRQLQQVVREMGMQPETFYAAIEAGMNQADIERALTTQYMDAKSAAFIHDAAKTLGMTAGEAADLLTKSGAADVVDKFIRGANTIEQVEGAFRRADREAQDWINIQTARELRGRAEDVRNRVGLEGAVAGLDVSQRAINEFFDAWFDHYDRFGELFEGIEQMDEASRSRAFEEAYRQSDENFRRVYAAHGSNFLGIFDAWGLSADPDALTMLQSISDSNNAMKAAYDTMRQVRRGLFEELKPGEITPTKAQWADAKTSIDQAFREAFEKKHNADVRQGQSLSAIYEKLHGPAAGEAARLWWDDVVKFSDHIVQEERKFRQTVDRAISMGASKEQIAAAKKQYYQVEKIAQIAQLEKLNQEGLARLERVVRNSKGGAGAPAGPAGPGGLPPMPLTRAAIDLLESVDQPGSMPAFITRNMRKIAKENGITVTDSMTAADVVDTLRRIRDGETIRQNEDNLRAIAENASTATPEDRLNTYATREGQTPAQAAAAEMAELRQKAQERAAQERAIRKQVEDGVWEIAQNYRGRDGKFTRGVFQHHMNILNALKKPEYGGDPSITGLSDPKLTPDFVRQVFENRDAIKLAEEIAKVDPIIKKYKKAIDPNNVSLLTYIALNGGLDLAKKSEYAGDAKARTPKNVFKPKGYASGFDLDLMAIKLAEEGKYPIDLNDPADPGGTRQTQELIRRELAGEKIYPVGHDYTAASEKAIQKAELQAIEAANEIETATAEPAFDEAAWTSTLDEAVRNVDLDRITQLTEQVQDRLDRIHPGSGVSYLERTSQAWDEAVELNAKQLQVEDIAQAKTAADLAVAEAESHAVAAETRQLLRESYAEIWGEEKAQAYMELSDSIAQWYERTTGESADDFYSRYYEDVRRSAEEDVIGGLEQDYGRIEPSTRTMDAQGAADLARMLVRAGESELRSAISQTDNKSDRIAILNEAWKLNPDMAENVARAERHLLMQQAAGQIWYSKLIQTVERIGQPRMTVDQLRGMISKGGVKADEAKWMGLETFLEGKTNVTKAELLEFLQQSQVKIEETTLGISVEDAYQKAKSTAVGEGYTEQEFSKAWGMISNTMPDSKPAAYKELGRLGEIIRPAQDVKPTATKYSSYTLPGGKNYREILFTLPAKQTGWIVTDKNNMVIERTDMKPTQEAINKAREQGYLVLPARAETSYQSSHWAGTPNVLAHTRLNDRIDADGKRVLFVEEIQSDWHQQGREKGYVDLQIEKQLADLIKEDDSLSQMITDLNEELKDSAELGQGRSIDEIIADKKILAGREYELASQIAELRNKKGAGVADAPFSKTWHEMVMKRILRMAADEGYERVAWTTGEQQAKRYDLAKQVDHITTMKMDDGRYQVTAISKDKSHSVFDGRVAAEKLPEIVGKDLAEKIVASQKEMNQWYGDSLAVGGEGMKGFYDKMLPSFLNKYAKQWDTQVGETKISAGEFDKGEIVNTNHPDIDIRWRNDQWEVYDGGAHLYDEEGGYYTGETPEEAIKNTGYEITDPLPGSAMPVHSIDITPAMRNSVMAGQPLFQRMIPAATPDTLAQQVWHGTPHKFKAERLVEFGDGTRQHITGDVGVLPEIPTGATLVKDYPLGRFRLDKMGTGEGAQAYGWGLYVAERRGIAEDYRKNLTNRSAKPTYKGMRPNEISGANQFFNSAVRRLLHYVEGGDTPQASREVAQAWLENELAAELEDMNGSKNVPKLEEALYFLENIDIEDIKYDKDGQLYAADIPDDGYLDWDKSVNQQPLVKKLIEKKKRAPFTKKMKDELARLNDILNDNARTPVGEELDKFYNDMNAKYNRWQFSDFTPEEKAYYDAKYKEHEAERDAMHDRWEELSKTPGAPLAWSETMASRSDNIEYKSQSAHAIYTLRLKQEGRGSARWHLQSTASRYTSNFSNTDVGLALAFKAAQKMENLALKHATEGTAMSGGEFYKTATAAYEAAVRKEHPDWNKDKVHFEGQKRTSLWLKDNGLNGVKLLDGVSRNSGRGTHNYVLFDDESIAILESFYQGNATKGAVVFGADGIKATIHAFEAADFSTLVHENAHVFRRVIKDVADRTNNPQVRKDLATIEEWAEVKNGVWTVEAEEKFARGFENYIATGEAPTPRLKKAFATFKRWMAEIYKTITGSAIDVKITPAVKDVFDRMLGAEEPVAPRVDKLYQRNLDKIKQAGAAPQVVDEKANPSILLQQDTAPSGTYEEASQFPPQAAAVSEGYSKQVRPLLDEMKKVAIAQMKAGTLGGASKDMSAEGQSMMRKYMRQVQADMAGTKNAATKWGETQRDFAMLNYNKRYGLDRWVETAFPYQFFYTRSLMTWAARALDKPAIFANYARIKKQQDRYERDVPERLRGKIKIPMPWMPDWMGDALYIDPIGSIFTPANYLRPFERKAQETSAQMVEAERILQEWAANGSVSQSDIAQAAKTREGKTWERAFAEAQIRREGELNNPVDFLSTMLGPAWYLTTPYKLLSGRGAEVTNTPGANAARAIDTVTQGTWAEPVGNAIGLLGKPEEMLRNQLGLPEFGEYGDYYVDRQLANMVADGLISSDEAQVAMIERKGETFDQARERVKMELAMRVPTAAALMAGLTADNITQGVARAAATAPASLFGSGLLPAGELEYRNMKQEWDQAWKMKDQGDDKAITAFFDEHPEYEAYLAKGKPPEERLRSFLVGQIWDGYMALGKTEQKQFSAEVGETFRRSFLDTETRSYESLNVDQLAEWAQMLKQQVPATPETLPAIQAAPEMNYYDPAITAITNRFFTDRTELFPNYYAHQQRYYDIPYTDKSRQLKYLRDNPEYAEYLKWKKAYYEEYPDLVPIMNGQAFKRIDTSGWPPALEDYVTAYAYTGKSLPPGAYAALQQEWLAAGRPLDNFQSWLDSQVVPGILYR